MPSHVECYTYPADLRDCRHVLRARDPLVGPLLNSSKFTTSQRELGFLVPHRWGPNEGPRKPCKVEVIKDVELLRMVDDDEFALQLFGQHAGLIIKKCVNGNPTGDEPYGGSALIGDKQVFRVTVLGVPTADTALPLTTGDLVTQPRLKS